MGSSFSSQDLTLLENLKVDDTTPSNDETHKTFNEEYIYLVTCNNNEYFFSQTSKDIVKFITDIRQEYINKSLSQRSLYSLSMYETIYNENQNSMVTTKTLLSLFNNEIKPLHDSETVYTLDITRSMNNVIIRYEVELEKLTVKKVYNLCLLVDDDDSSDDLSENEPPSESTDEELVTVSNEELKVDEKNEAIDTTDNKKNN